MSRNMLFAERLRGLRNARKWTQQQVADELGIKRSTYAYYETQKSEPDLQMLIRLATLFRTTIDFLIGFQDQSQAHTFLYNQAKTEETVVLTEREESMLQMFRAIDRDKQETVLSEMYRFLQESYNRFPSEESIHSQD